MSSFLSWYVGNGIQDYLNIMLKSPASLAPPPARAPWAEWGWVHGFMLIQFGLQILLLFPQFGALRVPMRVATFALSLFLLVWIPGPGIKLPTKGPAIAVIAILLLQLCFHPHLNSLMAGLAQCALYIAILAPLFWSTRLRITPNGFRWLIFIIWGFHTLSSFFGLLQTYYPGQFQPYLSTAVQNLQYKGENLKIILANGLEIYRPMGLTDSPGGAATAGLYALLLGIGILLHESNLLLRLAAIGSSLIGLYCVYLSEVRSILVLCAISIVTLMVALARQGRFARLGLLGVGSVGLSTMAFSWAIAVGGSGTFKRITSLFADKPDAVYQANRGHFLQDTFSRYLFEYPLGAGLGRWGMMNLHFGNPNNPLSRPLWVEIQWTGWLFDGGVPMLLSYTLALLITGWLAWQIAGDRRLGDFSLWASLIFAYDVGTFALLFNSSPFIGQAGMEFWLLNAALAVAASYQIWQNRQSDP
jgi:hypothetical protein